MRFHRCFTLPLPLRCPPQRSAADPWAVNEGRQTMRARRVAFGLLLAALALAATASAQQSAKSKPAAVKRLEAVNFISTCRFSHRAPDDPIVFPGHPAVSHDHSFVGNTTTDAFSPLSSLRAGSTTCRRQGENAGHRMPTLADDAPPAAPLRAERH